MHEPTSTHDTALAPDAATTPEQATEGSTTDTLTPDELPDGDLDRVAGGPTAAGWIPIGKPQPE